MPERPENLHAYLHACSSVLLLAPSNADAEHDACADLLTGTAPDETNVLGVTVTQTPDERLAVWKSRTDGLPKRGVVVDAGRHRRETVGTEAVTSLSTGHLDTLPEEAEPIDLGIAVARRLGNWENTPEASAVCLHSLTDLLGSFERASVLSLVDCLNRLCRAVGATSHHHLDPDAHAEETVEMLRPLYDAVIERTSDGGWTVTEAASREEAPSFRRSAAPPGGAASTDPDRPETVPMPYAFDEMLDLISVPRRRTLLYHLKDQDPGQIPLDDLVSAVWARERSIPVRQTPKSAETVQVSLVHVHLPKLAEYGILDIDSEESVIRYHGNPALESFLRYVETLELG